MPSAAKREVTKGGWSCLGLTVVRKVGVLIPGPGQERLSIHTSLSRVWSPVFSGGKPQDLNLVWILFFAFLQFSPFLEQLVGAGVADVDLRLCVKHQMSRIKYLRNLPTSSTLVKLPVKTLLFALQAGVIDSNWYREGCFWTQQLKFMMSPHVQNFTSVRRLEGWCHSRRHIPLSHTVPFQGRAQMTTHIFNTLYGVPLVCRAPFGSGVFIRVRLGTPLLGMLFIRKQILEWGTRSLSGPQTALLTGFPNTRGKLVKGRPDWQNKPFQLQLNSSS